MNTRGPARIVVIALLLAGMPANGVERGESMPSFQLPALVEGYDFSSETLRGKLVYLDFWASWCPPCLHSLPALNRIHADYEGQDLVVVAINLDEDPGEARRFLHKLGIDYLVLSDPQGMVAGQFDLPAMPTSYLIDRKGVVVWRHIGYKKKDEARIRESIDAAL